MRNIHDRRCATWRDSANMRLTQQIRIQPTLEQEIVLEALSEKCRLVYNFALKERREAFERGVKGVDYVKQQNGLPELKNKYPEYFHLGEWKVVVNDGMGHGAMTARLEDA